MMPFPDESLGRTLSEETLNTHNSDNITSNDDDDTTQYGSSSDNEKSHPDLEAGRRRLAQQDNDQPPPTPTGLSTPDGLEMLIREPSRCSARSHHVDNDDDDNSSSHHDDVQAGNNTGRRRSTSSATVAEQEQGEEGAGGATVTSALRQVSSVLTIPDSFYDRFTPSRKILIVSFCSFCAFLSPVSSTASLSATPEIAAEFKTSGSVIYISSALYLLFMGISPLVWSPLIQVFGRRKIYIIVAWGFLGTSIGSALAPELICFFVMRVLTAFLGMAFIIAGNAIMSDIYRPVERGTAAGALLIGMLVGPAVAPCLSGVIVTYSSWRTIFWLQTGLASFALAGSYLVLPETVYHKRWDDLAGVSGADKVKVLGTMVNPWRVARLWRYPNVLLAGLAGASLLWNMYGLLAPIRYTLNPRYNLTSPMQGGFFYLAPGMGYLTGTLLGGRWSDYTVKKWIRIRSGERVPEDRLRAAVPFMCVVAVCILIYGWTVHLDVGGIPLTVACLYVQGVAQLFCFPALNAYCMDVSPGRSAEMVGANYAMRYFAGTVSVAIVLPAIETIGLGWYSTISATLLVLCAAGTWYNARYGRVMREKVDDKTRARREQKWERKNKKLQEALSSSSDDDDDDDYDDEYDGEDTHGQIGSEDEMMTAAAAVMPARPSPCWTGTGRKSG